MSAGRGPLARALARLGALAVFRRRRPAAEAPPPPPEPAPAGEREPQVDPQAELLVALLLIAASVAAAGFVVFYVTGRDNQLLGLSIGIALLLAGVAAALAGKRVVVQEKSVGEYHDFGDAEEQQWVRNEIARSGAGLTRRRLLFSSLAAVGAALGAAAVVPIASLGPGVGSRVYDTPWADGTKVVDEKGEPITADDIGVGEFLTGFAKGASLEDIGSPVMIVRLDPSELDLPADRAESAPEGILAYSKICTHAGCAVSMFRYPLDGSHQPGPALVCPCHYSTFNPADGGSVEFGPAGRPLPQLPLRIASDRSLEAGGNFYEAIGPSYGGIREYPGPRAGS